MDKNKIHNLGSAATYKATHIVNMTEEKIGKITAEEIKEILKIIPSMHNEALEQSVQLRDAAAIGQVVLMSIYQITQDNIEKAVYPSIEKARKEDE